jgi:predicted MFS family arabinose efflux permease
MFGTGKGSGASMVMFMLGIAGTLICLIFGKILDRYRYEEADGMRRK